MSAKPAQADIRPNYSLSQFVETHLAQPGEWDDYIRVQSATAPGIQAIWAPNGSLPGQQELVHIGELPSAEFTLWNLLHDRFLGRFRAELLSGKWIVRAIANGKLDRETVAPDLAARAESVSFLDDRVGSFTFVEIHPLDAESRFLRLVWVIEQICAVVPPKEGFSKPQVEELAGRLLPFKFGTDVFKGAWREAKIPAEYRKSGP